MAASISFRAPELVPSESEDIQMKCEFLKKVLEGENQSKILKELKDKKSELQKQLDGEIKEFNYTKEILKQISDLRKIHDLEKKIENILDSFCFASKTGESLEHQAKELISSVKAMRNKFDICNLLIDSREQLHELTSEIKVEIKEFQENFTSEIVLAKDNPLLNEYLSETIDTQNKCAELVSLVERLSLHIQALDSIKINFSKD